MLVTKTVVACAVRSPKTAHIAHDRGVTIVNEGQWLIYGDEMTLTVASDLKAAGFEETALSDTSYEAYLLQCIEQGWI